MIGYYQIQSPLSQRREDAEDPFIASLQRSLGEELQRMPLSSCTREALVPLYVATGGSEGFFLEVFPQLKDHTCLLLTSGENNSLAASMEILSYLKAHGGSGEILHGDPCRVAGQLRALQNAQRGLRTLRGKTLGRVGAPSDWLIASAYFPDEVLSRLGLGFVSIPMEELLSEIGLQQYPENEYTDLFRRQGYDPAEVEKALYIYGAFQRLADRYRLCGVSVRCFDLLDTVHSTGCLALSILNSLGICGGCEGDMPALLSMAVLGSVAGEPVFMCNPSRFDTRTGQAVFAHCTVPVTMLERFCLNTHYESGIGAAVQGTFAKGDCTVFKCDGRLSRFHVQEGEILDTPFAETLCRTQVRVRLGDLSHFLTDPIGNHQLLCRGRHAEEIHAFFRLLSSGAGQEGSACPT